MTARFLFWAVENLVREVLHAVLKERRVLLVGVVAGELSFRLDLRMWLTGVTWGAQRPT